MLGTDYIITGKIAANKIATGTLNGFTITGSTISAKDVLKVSSNVWNMGTSHGLQFGDTLPGYSAPASIKYT